MEVTTSKYYKKLKSKKVEFSFGTYYFFENFVISELKEGIHFEWSNAEQLISEIIDHYGEHAKLGYISNRINNFSVNPQNWREIQETYDILEAIAVVTYQLSTYNVVAVENQFSKIPLKRCLTLDQAIAWMQKQLK